MRAMTDFLSQGITKRPLSFDTPPASSVESWGERRVMLAYAIGCPASSMTAGICLLYTFHYDFIPIHSHTYGIEAYHLPDGIRDGFTVNGGGDAEVFQFVVEEVYFVVFGFVVQLPQGIAE